MQPIFDLMPYAVNQPCIETAGGAGNCAAASRGYGVDVDRSKIYVDKSRRKKASKCWLFYLKILIMRQLYRDPCPEHGMHFQSIQVLLNALMKANDQLAFVTIRDDELTLL